MKYVKSPNLLNRAPTLNPVNLLEPKMCASYILNPMRENHLIHIFISESKPSNSYIHK